MTAPSKPDAPIKMFPGEAFRPPTAPIVGGLLSDAEIEAKYAAGDVRIVTEQARYPLPQIPTMLSSGDYRIDPDYQRRTRWSPVRQSRLIESFIINVPVPPIFLYEVAFAKYEVMDGLQRLTAIRDFYDDKLVLEGMEQWQELNGRRYTTLPESIRRGVDRRYLSSIVLLRETAKNTDQADSLKSLVFERINSGGEHLSPQESRNALFDGAMNRMCKELSKNEALCRTWSIPLSDEVEGDEPADQLLDTSIEEDAPDRRHHKLVRSMGDVELVLRFFAYRHRLSNQEGALKGFLDSYLRQANKYPEKTLKQLGELFIATIGAAHAILGDKAFWLYRKPKNGTWAWKRRPTTTVYDPLMFALSQNIQARDTLVAKKDAFEKKIQQVFEENAAAFEGRYTNKEDLRRRNDLMVGLVNTVARS